MDDARRIRKIAAASAVIATGLLAGFLAILIYTVQTGLESPVLITVAMILGILGLAAGLYSGVGFYSTRRGDDDT